MQGRDHRADRADLVRLPDEPQLRFGELLAGVADHQQRVGIGQQPEGGRQVRLAVPTDAGGVDEGQAAPQQRAGRTDLHPQHLPAPGLRRAPQVVADVGDGDGDGLRRHVASGGDHQSGGGLVGVGDDGDQCGGLVVADTGHRNVQQRVEQLTLALLELPGDHHPDLRVGDAFAGHREPGGQVSAIVEFGDRGGVVDQLDDHRNPARVWC